MSARAPLPWVAGVLVLACGGASPSGGDASSDAPADAASEPRSDGSDAPDDGGDDLGDAPDEADALDDAPVEVAPCMSLARVEVATPPPARQAHAMAFDPERKVVVSFGGVDANEAAHADIWEWDGAVWREASPAPLPTTWPHGRKFAAIAYDDARRRLVIMGGDFDASPYGDWWEWDAATSTMTERPPPAAWPAARSRHGFVYDGKRARFVVFGGVGADGQPLDDLWEVDANGGALVAVDRTPTPRPAAWPAARIVNGGMSYDAAHGRTLLFGGQIATVTYKADMWAWDGTAGKFTDDTPASLPVAWPRARACHGTAWDARRERLMLFGGCAPAFQRDLWDWNPATGAWIDRTPAVLPPTWPMPQAFPAIAYDDARGVLVAWGGGSAGGGSTFSDQTFEYTCSE